MGYVLNQLDSDATRGAGSSERGLGIPFQGPLGDSWGSQASHGTGAGSHCRSRRVARSSLNDQSRDLTKAERQLLDLFVRHTGKVLTAGFIAEMTGIDVGPAVHVSIRQLQRKLESLAPESRLFVTVPGVGWMYVGAPGPRQGER